MTHIRVFLEHGASSQTDYVLSELVESAITVLRLEGYAVQKDFLGHTEDTSPRLAAYAAVNPDGVLVSLRRRDGRFLSAYGAVVFLGRQEMADLISEDVDPTTLFIAATRQLLKLHDSTGLPKIWEPGSAETSAPVLPFDRGEL